MSSPTRNSFCGLVATFAMLVNVLAMPTGQKKVNTIPLLRHRVPVTVNDKVVAHKTSYVGRIAVGSPLQPFKVVFDTGSGHVVLPSVECESEACMKHARYDQDLSPDSVPINLDKTVMQPDEPYDEVTVHYGTGSVDGTFVMENVCIGSLNSVGPCARMGFIQASELSHEPFHTFPADGIFGLGLTSLALDPEFSFFSMIAKNGSQSQVGMFIGQGDEDSELCVGGHNPARLASPLSWVSVANAEMGYWQVQLRGVHINDEELDVCRDGTCRAILDTGASHIGVPYHIENLIEDLLSVPAGSLENCRTVAWHSISFELPGVNLTIGPENYMRPLPLHTDVHSGPIRAKNSSKMDLLSNGLSRLFAFGEEKVASNDMWCRPLLTPALLPPQFGEKIFILGEPVLRQYYTVFDGASPALGFGLALQDNEAFNKKDDAIIFMQQGFSTKKNGDEVALVQILVIAKKVIKTHKTNLAQVAQACCGESGLASIA